jgi:hypothetical protein
MRYGNGDQVFNNVEDAEDDYEHNNIFWEPEYPEAVQAPPIVET